MRWMHSVRLYPNAVQERAIEHALHLTRNLYNAALDQRKYEYRAHGRTVTVSMQGKELTALRAESPSDAGIYREVQEAVLHRLDNAMRAFFSCCRKGETPGFPRFKNDARWNQFEYPHGDRAVKFTGAQAKMRLPGVGFVRLGKGREVPWNYGRVFITRKNARWYATFECKREVEPMAATGRVIGIPAYDCGEGRMGRSHNCRSQSEIHVVNVLCLQSRRCGQPRWDALLLRRLWSP